MKKIISWLLSFSLLFVINFSFVKAEDHVNPSNDQSTILRNEFTLNEDLSVTEFVNAEFGLDSYVIYLTTFQDNSYELKMFVNGELCSHTTGLNGNYELALINYNKQFLIVPFNCPLTDNVYQHFFISSSTYTYEPTWFSDWGSTIISSFVSAFLYYAGAGVGATAAYEIAATIISNLVDFNMGYGMIVENYYEVYLRSNGQYYCVCKHFNVIPTDSEGRVIAGGGMYYYQY